MNHRRTLAGLAVAVTVTMGLMVGCSSMKNASLEGTRWRLVSIETSTGEIRNASAGEEQPFIEFAGAATEGNARSLRGFGGCNRLNATYEVEGHDLSISEVAATRMSCGTEVNGIEHRLSRGLHAAASFEIEGTQLRIQSDGNILHFTSTEPFEPGSTESGARIGG